MIPAYYTMSTLHSFERACHHRFNKACCLGPVVPTAEGLSTRNIQDTSQSPSLAPTHEPLPGSHSSLQSTHYHLWPHLHRGRWA
jgi:hypothetical protein